MIRFLAAVSLVACSLPFALAQADEEPSPGEGLSIGVAPFQEVAPPGAALPDVGGNLAEAIEALGVSRIVGPGQLGAPDLAEPAPDLVREIAMDAGVDVVVVGRTTRLGDRLSIDVRLRSGRTGAVAGTYVAEAATSESLEPVLARLGEQVVSGARAVTEGRPHRPGDAAGPPEPPPAAAAPVEPQPEPEGGDAPFGLGGFDDGERLSIRSDELEATDRDGARTLMFRNNVEVLRGDLTLRADSLKAFYPPDAKHPRNLSAQGSVTVAQGNRSARCDRAVYEHAAERIVCSGNAELRDGDDRIRGERITFDLAARRVSVDGGVHLLLRSHSISGSSEGGAPSASSRPGVEGLAALESDAPLAISADRLEAFEREGRREIRFEGDVEVVRSDVVLRSHRLEAIYPDVRRQPDRLVATGEVVLTQGAREARCERAVYHREERRVECAGNAELRDGEDRVRGEVIAFDLEAETVVVTGNTRLLFRPEGEPGETALP